MQFTHCKCTVQWFFFSNIQLYNHHHKTVLKPFHHTLAVLPLPWLDTFVDPALRNHQTRSGNQFFISKYMPTLLSCVCVCVFTEAARRKEIRTHFMSHVNYQKIKLRSSLHHTYIWSLFYASQLWTRAIFFRSILTNFVFFIHSWPSFPLLPYFAGSLVEYLHSTDYHVISLHLFLVALISSKSYLESHLWWTVMLRSWFTSSSGSNLKCPEMY